MKIAEAPQDIRFPSEDEDIKHGEVKISWLSPEKIREKYGPPLSEQIPKEEILRLKKKGMNHQQIAERFGIEVRQVGALLNLHRARKGEKKVGTENLTPSKESYIRLKQEGKTDRQIARIFNIHQPELTEKKKEWGVAGLSLRDLKNDQNAKSEEQSPVPEKEKPAAEEEPDMVYQPPHYKAGGIETIDYIKAKLTGEQFEGYLLGNVFKYLSRYRHKNGIEDIEKASWYMDRLLGEMDQRR